MPGSGRADHNHAMMIADRGSLNTAQRELLTERLSPYCHGAIPGIMIIVMIMCPLSLSQTVDGPRSRVTLVAALLLVTVTMMVAASIWNLGSL